MRQKLPKAWPIFANILVATPVNVINKYSVRFNLLETYKNFHAFGNILFFILAFLKYVQYVGIVKSFNKDVEICRIKCEEFLFCFELIHGTQDIQNCLQNNNRPINGFFKKVIESLVRIMSHSRKLKCRVFPM